MPEYVNIISKEAVTKPSPWPMTIVSIVAIVGVFVTLIITLRQRKKIPNPSCTAMLCFGFGGLVAQLVATLLAAIFLQVPTGQYAYTATIDKEIVSVTEYEDFIEEYRPTIVNDTYIWVGN